MSVNIEPAEPRKLRAMVEIVDGELKIFPIAETDEQAQEIIDTIFCWKNDA